MAEQQAQANGGGIGIVGGLRHVHVVVRVQVLVFTFGVAYGLKTQAGDHPLAFMLVEALAPP